MRCLLFVTKLYNNNTVNRSVIQDVIDNTSELLNSIFSKIKSQLNLPETSGSNCNELSILLSKDLFETCNSEHKRFKILEELGYFIRPKSFFIGNMLNTTTTSNNTIVEHKPCEEQIIPLRKILKKVLEMPNILSRMLNFIAEEEIKEEEISSLFNSDWWKTVKQKYSGKLVLPLYIYFDEFETGNPLGTQAGVHKLGGVYFSFAATPPKYSSRIENIFLWGLFFSSDRVVFSNKNVFQPFINELKYLEFEGVVVKGKRIFFIAPLLLGDNLGINSITGMTESFSSIYFCRSCTAPKQLTQNMISENRNLLRKKNEYHIYLREKIFGVKEACVWNELPYFHNTENIHFDIMHDIYEGICRYDFGKILKYFIYEKKYFSLETLNNRIKQFDYTEADIGNKFPPITLNQVEKEMIIMSSSEMHAFVTYFGMLVYDLIEPSDQVWELYLLLFNITNLVSNGSFSEDELIYLNNMISEHHKLYVSEFKSHLTPKYHFLLHYSRTMKKFGPLSRLSSIRYEAFHKISKSNANVVSSRRNIPLTLSIKHQLRLAHRLISNKGFLDNIALGTLSTFEKEEFPFSCNLSQFKNTFVVSWIRVNGNLFKPGFIIQVGQNTNLEPKFGRIKNILYNSDENIKFIYEKLLCCGINKQLEAYEIIERSKTMCDIIDLKNIFHIPTSIHATGDGCKYVTAMNQE
ncbi:unnamed protein product [Ceutorhynchus assimilis]|uniref:Uncharacterized protein n=1 Tax=Ceutorhynchus assimilis TaxID=467358 RepID=A0A9N9N290_9CUCU|nr:unnamed protein product [Ceutorhynchus assimilis]